jgi:1,4-alpha-glucan branching enzyme
MSIRDGRRVSVSDPGGTMSLKKQYLKSEPVCKVTFRLPPEAARDASKVTIVGDFNDWNLYAMPMKKHKDGTFSVTLKLVPEHEYQYRFLIDEQTWENDWEADKYVPSPFGSSDNSVVVV